MNGIRATVEQLSQSKETGFGRGASTEAVDRAQSDLHVRFSHDYREFCLAFGSGYAGGEHVFGVEDVCEPNVESVWEPDVVWQTHRMRRDFPHAPLTLVCVSRTDYGTFALDCADPDKTPVYVIPAGETAFRLFAQSFGEFLTAFATYSTPPGFKW